MTRYIIFDTETTDVSAEKQAVEVALIELNPDMSIKGEAQSLICPTKTISPEALAVHGITIEMLSDKPTIEQWVEQEFGGRLEGEVTLIGHKVYFDAPLFAPIGDASRVVDTLIHSQVVFPDAPNHKLETLREFLGISTFGSAHRAMVDVLTTHQLLKEIVARSGRSLEALCSIDKFFIHRMPWGKHEGKPLMAVPKGYRDWLLKKDIDPNLRYSLEEVGKLDIPLPAPRAFHGKPSIVIPKRVIK